MIKSLKDLLNLAKDGECMRLAVAAAEDIDVLIAVCKATRERLIEPILVGDIDKMDEIATVNRLDISDYKKISSSSLEESAKICVDLVRSDEADFIMKGLLDTSILLKAVVNREAGLRTDNLISHVMVYEIPNYHKLLMITDGGMNISPSLEDKKSIIKNAVNVAKALGNDEIKVACICAKEKLNPKMPATVDADKLQGDCERGEFGDNVIVEGPIAFDLAISSEAAKHKSFKSQIAGDTDIMLVPTIEVGNGIGKSLTYFASANSAGIVMGAKVPIVLTSRADSAQTKLNSIALGVVVAKSLK